MEIKLREVVNSQDALTAILNDSKAPRNPDGSIAKRRFKRTQFGRRIGNLARQLEPHLKQCDELTQQVYASHGTESEDKKSWEIAVHDEVAGEDGQIKKVVNTEKTNAVIAEINKEIAALGSEVITLDHTLMAWEWIDAEGIELTALEILTLAPFMEA